MLPIPTLGLSQVFAKIFDQLSVTAWLPAALFVATASVLVELDTTEANSVIEAIGGLAGVGGGGIVVLLFALLVVTTITQSAEFSAIRFLEGYWGTGRVSAALCTVMIRHQRARRTRLKKAARHALEAAQISADHEWRRWGISDAARAAALSSANSGTAELSGYSSEALLVAQELDWKEDATPETMHRVTACQRRWATFPEGESRIMPTRLGNVLRGAEDRMNLPTGEDLRGFVIRNLGRIPADLLSEHDVYRNKLDMYCVLTLVSAVLGVVAPAWLLVGDGSAWEALCAVFLFAALSLAAVRAAATSASSYGTVLIEIGRTIRPVASLGRGQDNQVA